MLRIDISDEFLLSVFAILFPGISFEEAQRESGKLNRIDEAYNGNSTRS